MSDRGNKIERALLLAEASGYDKGHTEQVRRLALKIFDGLAGLHGAGAKERALLEQAAILHDIGWADGAKDHHKLSRDRILAAPGLLFDDEEERIMVAQIARYHKGALPKKKHKHNDILSAKSRTTVEKLAAILRVADGLDRAHSGSVGDIRCEVAGSRVVLRIKEKGLSDLDKTGAMDKSDLFRKVFDKTIEIVSLSE